MDSLCKENIQLLKNNAVNSKAAFLKLRNREKLTEADRATIIQFYLEVISRLEGIC